MAIHGKLKGICICICPCISVEFQLDSCWISADVPLNVKRFNLHGKLKGIPSNGKFCVLMEPSFQPASKEKFSNCIYFSKRFPLFSLEQVDWSLFNAEMINLVQPHRTAGKDLKLSWCYNV